MNNQYLPLILINYHLILIITLPCIESDTSPDHRQRVIEYSLQSQIILYEFWNLWSKVHGPRRFGQPSPCIFAQIGFNLSITLESRYLCMYIFFWFWFFGFSIFLLIKLVSWNPFEKFLKKGGKWQKNRRARNEFASGNNPPDSDIDPSSYQNIKDQGDHCYYQLRKKEKKSYTRRKEKNDKMEEKKPWNYEALITDLNY